MEAIRKIQTVKDGQVQLRLPKQFWGQQVEIIVFAVPQQECRPSSERSLQGCLRQYANPALIALEQDAWQEAVKKKHDPR
ncbi:hypothetical protein [Candidatus Electronema sp. PJ]|uniref:hypothetical protein n=1 Tax=Candidatus Electronema sp. PJ TaxID=3401572 RepID=UPI003AA85E6B